MRRKLSNYVDSRVTESAGRLTKRKQGIDDEEEDKAKEQEKKKTEKKMERRIRQERILQQELESQSEHESLRTRIREVEDENQELRAQNLTQNRTIVELRNEIVLLRIQMNELTETSALLRERIRTLAQNGQQGQQQQQQQQQQNGSGPVTAPPLMPPPPVPPPLPPARIRISPRQVGAGEALTTPLGVSLSSPPRHRVKRDCRQGFYRSSRIPYRRFDSTEPGPSSQTPFFSPDRPNYFFGLKIIPQFQTSIVCSQNLSSGYSDSASDSSGSDETPQVIRNPKNRPSDPEPPFKNPNPSIIPRNFDLLGNVSDLHHQKLGQTILHNYNLSLPNTNSKFFFPLSWDRKTRDNPTLPSTSGNQFRFFQPSNPDVDPVQPPANIPRVSNCVQYTFPTIHEGLNQNGIHSVVTNTGHPSRLRKFKKNIPYLSPGSPEDPKDTYEDDLKTKNLTNGDDSNPGVDSESLSSMDELRRSMTMALAEQPSDFEQDGFQADESSNCMTSTDNSLEQICISESNLDKKN